MSRLDTFNTLVQIGKTIVDGTVAIIDARRRTREEEERKRREIEEREKDERIRKLEDEVARLKAAGRSER